MDPGDAKPGSPEAPSGNLKQPKTATALPSSGSSLIIGALACFIIAQANESFITITILEIFIVLFFILIYMLTLHHLLTYLHWPLLDLTNSIITAVFLSVVAILAMQEKKRRHLFYVGGSLCLTAVIVCCIDAFVVTKMMRTNLKRFLGIEFESKFSSAKDTYPETGPDAPQRPA
ncbi:PREDICTED: CKLF-like MARVEL transmembrane domain-containing protein 1 isoform X2 [Mandrillus leucophaeus]|uniref:CKLF-like MARVEL transmembrane domain-containing protein 1 isoform X2 n=1 Tax=Mandrillus leucophaeus TaxID=9568 RepID=UPI0005F3F63C|nr:PREDICTED: CKLF-like MARVEL transmembrane domain-containing protein 1 isoform X2 [Mandrillus leucophaeus]